ncbi:MAG: methylated-DNA--[protein]-cysteine S-methyltransferase [Acidobacteriota bacterium]
MNYWDAATPVGDLRLAGDEAGLREISFHAAALALPSSPCWRRAEEPFRLVLEQLSDYFSGARREFDLPLAPVGTPFQLDVWRMLRTIPYGETVTYGEIAGRLGRPRAQRAVGAANGRNPLPIVIPCHRVVGSDGSLTGFGGGLPMKRRLLALECGHLPALRMA